MRAEHIAAVSVGEGICAGLWRGLQAALDEHAQRTGETVAQDKIRKLVSVHVGRDDVAWTAAGGQAGAECESAAAIADEQTGAVTTLVRGHDVQFAIAI